MVGYIDGILSKPNEDVDFLLCDLWFANENDGNEYECLLVSGAQCETVVDGNRAYTRWKGFNWGNAYTDKDLEDLIKKLEGKRLVNAVACFNEDVDFTITRVELGGYEFPMDKVDNPIEFIV